MNSASPDRDFDDNEYRNFEPPRQPEEEQEDIQELHERTMNRHCTEDPIPNTTQYYIVDVTNNITLTLSYILYVVVILFYMVYKMCLAIAQFVS